MTTAPVSAFKERIKKRGNREYVTIVSSCYTGGSEHHKRVGWIPLRIGPFTIHRRLMAIMMIFRTFFFLNFLYKNLRPQQPIPVTYTSTFPIPIRLDRYCYVSQSRYLKLWSEVGGGPLVSESSWNFIRILHACVVTSGGSRISIQMGHLLSITFFFIGKFFCPASIGNPWW